MSVVASVVAHTIMDILDLTAPCGIGSTKVMDEIWRNLATVRAD